MSAERLMSKFEEAPHLEGQEIHGESYEVSLNGEEWTVARGALRAQAIENNNEVLTIENRIKEARESGETSAEGYAKKQEGYLKTAQHMQEMDRQTFIKIGRDVPDFNNPDVEQLPSTEEYTTSLTLIDSGIVEHALLQQEAKELERMYTAESDDEVKSTLRNVNKFRGVRIKIEDSIKQGRYGKE